MIGEEFWRYVSMSIRMIGIDYHRADIDTRGVFSFTRKHAAALMEKLVKKPGIRGCVLLSTCNRMELTVSLDEKYEGSLLEEVCAYKGVDAGAYVRYFVEREGREAVGHLFYLTCGLRSMILAEDQIPRRTVRA